MESCFHMSDPVGKPTTLIPIEGVFKPPAKKSKKAKRKSTAASGKSGGTNDGKVALSSEGSSSETLARDGSIPPCPNPTSGIERTSATSTKWQFYQPPVYEYDEKSKAKKRYRPSQSYRVEKRVEKREKKNTTVNTQRYDTENSREQESDKRSKEELTFAKALLKHATRVEFDLKGLANEFRYHPDFTKVVFLRFYNSWGCVFRHNAGAGVPASNFVLGNSGENPFSVPAQGSSGSTPISVPLPPPPPPASGDNGWAPDLVAGLDYEPGELFASPPLPGSVPGTPGPIPGPPGVGDGLVSCMPTPVSSDVVAVPSPFYADRTGDMLLTDPVLNEGGWRDNPFDENYDWDNSEPSTYSHPVRPFSGLMWRDGYDVGN